MDRLNTEWAQLKSNSLSWKFHGQKSLAGYSLQGRKESNTMEATEHKHIKGAKGAHIRVTDVTRLGL